jgi:hypothetical protein
MSVRQTLDVKGANCFIWDKLFYMEQTFLYGTNSKGAFTLAQFRARFRTSLHV